MCLPWEKELSQAVELQKNKYLNNLVKQDHSRIQLLTKAGMWFVSFSTARRTIKGYEIMQMIRKGLIQEVAKGAVTD